MVDCRALSPVRRQDAGPFILHSVIKLLCLHATLSQLHIFVMCRATVRRLWPRPASFFLSQPVQESSLFANPPSPCASPERQLATGVLDRSSPTPTALQWRPKPERFAVR